MGLTFRTLVRQLLAEGRTQRALAIELGVTPNTIGRYLHEHALPAPTVALRVARMTGHDPREVLHLARKSALLDELQHILALASPLTDQERRLLARLAQLPADVRPDAVAICLHTLSGFTSQQRLKRDARRR